MALIIPEGYWAVRMNWTSILFDSGRGATTFGVAFDGSPAAAAGHVATTFASAGGYTGLSNLVTLASVDVWRGLEQATAPVNEIGDLTGTFPPPNCAVLVSKRSNVRSPRARGRMFLPFMCEEANVYDDGTMKPEHVTALQEIFDDWADKLQVEDCPMVILQHTGGISPPLSEPVLVGRLRVENKMATQRRRLRR